MPAPVVATVGAESKGTGTAATLGSPAGLAAGDLLLAFFSSDTSTNTFTPPGEGWTLIARGGPVGEGGSGAGTAEVWRKIAVGGDSLAFTQSAAGPWAGIACRVTGHDPAGPVPVSKKSASSTPVTSLKSGTITTPRDDCLVITFFTEDGDTSAVNWASEGATEIFDFQEGVSFVEIAGYTEIKEKAGEISRTGSLPFGANECESIIFAVQPPAGGAPSGPRPGSRSLLGVGR